MKLAYTMAPERGDTDLLLERLANDLAARGIRCCGTVQINSERANAGPCDMDVRVLPHGAVIRISQDLGTLARGCRLDPAALETAAGLVATGLSSGTDLLIINKLGGGFVTSSPRQLTWISLFLSASIYSTFRPSRPSREVWQSRCHQNPMR